MLVRGRVGQRSETVRRANLSAIVRELHVSGPISRSELVARTGLTRSAIRGLIGELAAAGLVVEGRAAPLGTPGRPSPVVRPASGRAVVLALEIEVDSLAAAVGRPRRRGPRTTSGSTGRAPPSVDAVDADLAELAATVLRDAGPLATNSSASASRSSGSSGAADGLVSMAPNLGWRDAPLGDASPGARPRRSRSRSRTRRTSAALAEIDAGAAVGADEVLFISGEVGSAGA